MHVFVHFAMFMICNQKFTAAICAKIRKIFMWVFVCMCVCRCVCAHVGKGTSGLNARQQRKFAKQSKNMYIHLCLHTYVYTHTCAAGKFCVTQNVQLIEIVSLYLLICSYLGTLVPATATESC